MVTPSSMDVSARMFVEASVSWMFLHSVKPITDVSLITTADCDTEPSLLLKQVGRFAELKESQPLRAAKLNSTFTTAETSSSMMLRNTQLEVHSRFLFQAKRLWNTSSSQMASDATLSVVPTLVDLLT
jgi:hypothetical protein